MRKASIDELQPGMMTAAPVYSRREQLLVPERTLLTTQKISHMEYYGIQEVFVFTEAELAALDLDGLMNTAVPDTYSQRVKRSPRFKRFKAEYDTKVEYLKGSLNDVIKRDKPVNQSIMLEQVSRLYDEHTTTISMFDMLHSMRQIDDSTYAHSVNVALISRMLGQWLNLTKESLDFLTVAGMLHDIGKCMVDQDIISKPGRLSDAEFDEIKKHPGMGYDILKNQDLDLRIKYSALMHHERRDGTGYPLGLTGDNIDAFAQIVSIADVYDAMTANRCYRKGLCPFEVIATFEREGLSKYKPEYILTFLKHITDTYMNNNVVLNDGRQGSIVMINNQSLSRPIVKLEDGTFEDLYGHQELFIEAIL